MTNEQGAQLYTAGKLAVELGISQGKVKKLIEAQNIQPDEIKRNCKYYGVKTLEKLRTQV
ncbi:MAG: hypothetical protein FVQ83_03465 [Chloroflexi bacterium]|nr:hypothetical protein [Chloroflexota bacterium]